MSSAMSGVTCPMPPTKTTSTISNDTGNGAFRRVDKPKEDVKTWWEHEATVEVSFCKEKSESWMQQTAKEFVEHLNPNSCYQNPYRFEGINRTSDNTMVIKISAKGSLTPNQVKDRLDTRVPVFLGNWMSNHPVATASFDFKSEQKQEITRYTVQDGFERV